MLMDSSQGYLRETYATGLFDELGDRGLTVVYRIVARRLHGQRKEQRQYVIYYNAAQDDCLYCSPLGYTD